MDVDAVELRHAISLWKAAAARADRGGSEREVGTPGDHARRLTQDPRRSYTFPFDRFPMDKLDLALDLFQEAYEQQMNGDLERAISLYKRSLSVLPTAEAHTFLGWTYAFQKRYDEAISECEKAIQTDPEFGNPYNDIGAYLIEKGALDDAVPWLERAKRAPRYEPRHFPYLNLGRLYMAKGDLSQALREFREALKVHPHDPLAEGAARMIRSRMN